MAVFISVAAQVLIALSSLYGQYVSDCPLQREDWLLVGLFAYFPLFPETVALSQAGVKEAPFLAESLKGDFLAVFLQDYFTRTRIKA